MRWCAASRQPETFAKPVTDGASAARRHFGKSVMLCLISNLAASRRSILGFQAAYFMFIHFPATAIRASGWSDNETNSLNCR